MSEPVKMTICRRDLNAIAKVMDAFGHTRDEEPVEIVYAKSVIGTYELSINFGCVINNIVGRMHVVIDEFTLD